MADIGENFRALHQPGNPFILANAWDIGSAKVLASMGAQAIGTTSSGYAFTLGRPDMGTVTRDEALSHSQSIVESTNLPVSGDLENGFGNAPDDVAETVRLAAEIGLAGCSVEDTNMLDKKSYDFDFAVERVRAGAAAARGLGKDFVFVARADGILNKVYDIEEALRRLQAFDEVGADCLYAPMPPSMDDLKRIVSATTKPINALAAGPFAKVKRDEFAAAGIARISLGGALARVTQAALISAAKHILKDGDFSDFLNAASSNEVDALLDGQRGELNA